MTKVPDRGSAAEKRYFGWVAQLPCVVSLRKPVQVAHIRHPDAWFDKPLAGTGRKPKIPYVLPLTPEMHREQEASGAQWWANNGFNPDRAQISQMTLCWTLWRIYLSAPAEESWVVACRIIEHWRDIPMEGAG